MGVRKGGGTTHKPLRTRVREGARAGQAWRKKPDDWPAVNRDPEELPYIKALNRLFTGVLLIREDARTPSRWVLLLS